MSVVFQLKTIEAKKDIDVALLIYDYNEFFSFLRITEKYKKITDINAFTDLVKNGDFSTFGFANFEDLILKLNIPGGEGLTSRKIDIYINFIIDALHYNYNLILVNMSGTPSTKLINLKASLNENSVKFIIYDPLLESTTSSHINVFIETKIPVIFNSTVNYPNSTSTPVFLEREYIFNKNIGFTFPFNDCNRISGLQTVSEDFKPFVFCSTGVKLIQRYYSRDDVDGEFGTLYYVPISLVSDAAGAMSRSFTQYPWYSPAGFERGKILNQNFTTAENAPSSEEIVPYTPSDLSGSSTSALGIAYSRGLNTFLNVPNQANVNEYFLLSDFCGITQSATPIKTSISYGNLISYISFGVKTILNSALFEINDEGLRNSTKFRIESFLQPIVANQGIDEYRIVCDGSNNSQTDVLNRKLNVDVYIKPSQSINFVELSFTT
jgi:hypothetical protein